MTMLGSSVYEDIDDNEPPPGFGPMRAQQALTGYGTAPAYRPSPSNQLPYADQHHSTYPQHPQQSRPEGAVRVGAGAARQFHKALSSSIADAKNQAKKIPSAHSPNQQPHAPSLEPDYGDCADDDSDYGSSNNRRTSSRQSAACRPRTRNHTSNNTSTHTSSPSSASWSPTPRQHDRHSSQSPAAHAQQHQHHQHYQQNHHHNHHHSSSPLKSPAPDYGEYADADDYGSDAVTAKGGRGRRANTARQDSGSPAGKQGQPAWGGKSSRGRSARGAASRSKPDSVPGHSQEQALKLAAELETLQSALQEAEARQVEAQMAVLTLETDNTTLQAQLQDLRRQKQQLEMMLLFGGDTNSGDSPYEGEEEYTGEYSDTGADDTVEDGAAPDDALDGAAAEDDDAADATVAAAAAAKVVDVSENSQATAGDSAL